MQLIKPFKGLRPARDLAAKVASHPYDVLNRDEAYELAKDNPVSFLHINKPEVDMDRAVSVYDPSVYAKGASNLQDFIAKNILRRDEEERFYVYRQIMGDHVQTGLVAVASVEAYENNLIKKHEFTRPDKEDDRVNHMDALDAQVGPVFLTYQAEEKVDALVSQVTGQEPEYEFDADDGTRHVFWVVKDAETTTALQAAFDTVPCLYVADGHHRSAAASRVQKLRAARNANHTGEESYNFFLVVVFPHNQMQILDYNRVVQDLNGHEVSEFLAKLEEDFMLERRDRDLAKPSQAREFGLYVDGQWYLLTANANLLGRIDESDPVASLDVSILQNAIFGPLLNIIDQRTDKRVDFVGGIRGMKELEKRVNSGECQAAFAIYPTSVESLMAIADAGEVMPPKSTWFEPKLKSGLVVHVLD